MAKYASFRSNLSLKLHKEVIAMKLILWAKSTEKNLVSRPTTLLHV